ncbi:protein N-lysine methyltransferase METTL21D-like [Corticium candelabrum]|uniref:protein N-lysine methyltransferase METTL21D-like n=1 Tax=Corticium candelabrum TaxID=121492 RepID=UPI002E25396E|nr:protein N-lysine methyltransferase METTL21D-like [Corticium candelabrum]
MSVVNGQATFVRELELRCGVLRVHQLTVGDVGCVVWDAALVLAGYVEKQETTLPEYWKNRRVVELGAGTGIVGLVAACYGAHVTLTDLPEFVELMNLNVLENSALVTGSARAQSLTWGQDWDKGLDGCEVILMSDVVYYEQSLEPLVKTLGQLTRPGTKILMSYEERTSSEKQRIRDKFFELMMKEYVFRQADSEELDEHFRSEDIIVIEFSLGR